MKIGDMEKTTTGFGLTKLNIGKKKISSKQFFKLLLTTVIFTNAIAIGLATYSMYESHESILQHTRNNAENLSLILQKNVESTVNRISLILSDVSNETIQTSSETNGLEKLSNFLNIQREYLSEIDNLGIINAQASLIYQFNTPFYQELTSKSNFYEITKKSSKNTLVVSDPLILGKTNEVYLILSKKIEKNGNFYGVTFTVLPINYLNSLFQSISMGEHGSIVLRNSAAKLITHYPENNLAYSFTNNKPPSLIFQNALKNKLSHLTYRVVSTVDNQDRIYSFQKIGKLPLYINIGLAPEDVLISWNQELLKIGGLLFIFFIISSSGAIYIFNSWRTISKNDDKLQLILQSAGEAIYGIDNKGLCTFCNKACIQLLGYQHESELLGKHMHSLIHHTSKDGKHQHSKDCNIRQTLSHGLCITSEDDIFWRPDGICFPVEYQSYPQIANGKIVGAVVNFTDITEKKQINNIIWKQANFDTLTQLPNRYQFQQKLHDELEKTEKSQQKFALLFIDLDHFKDVNDSMGHHTGDILLQEVANRLSNCVRKDDTVARLGGDEFTVILSNIIEGESVDCYQYY
jgi:PAS domain S-box-containing protein